MAGNVNQRQVATIDVLPDDVLLTIFDFYVVACEDLESLAEVFRPETKRKIESWQPLIHVCRRWRGLVFGSPRRLKLRLCCKAGRSARMSVDVWPALPLIIQGGTSVDEIAPKLRYSNRISRIDLACSTILQFETVSAAMQVPFPELEDLSWSLRLACTNTVPVLPDSFLGRSAPRLRSLALDSIPFPGLSNLLLSATHLVTLTLRRIPHSGYFSPEAIATCLSMLTSLEELQLEFGSPQSCPDPENRRPLPPTRFILPALIYFSFKGVNEYLEDLVSWVDSPQLIVLETTFFNDIDFNTSELIQFIRRTPEFAFHDDARLVFCCRDASLGLYHNRCRTVEVKILTEVSDWQLSSLAQICTLSLHLFLTTENLYIYEGRMSPPNWKDDSDIENTEWFDLLLPFTAVKNLYLSKQFSPRIAPALQELAGGRTTEVLPALQNLLLEGFQPSVPVHEGIEQFISSPITLLPFLSGIDRVGSMIGSCPSSVSLTLTNPVISCCHCVKRR